MIRLLFGTLCCLCLLQLAHGQVTNCSSLNGRACKKNSACVVTKLKRGQCAGATCHPQTHPKKKGKYCVDFSCSAITKQKKCPFPQCLWIANACTAVATAATKCSDTTDKKECLKSFPASWGCTWDRATNTCVGPASPTPMPIVVPPPTPQPTQTPAPTAYQGDCFTDLFTGMGVSSQICAPWPITSGGTGTEMYPTTSDWSGFWYQGVQTQSGGDQHACWWHTRNQQWMTTATNANALVRHFGFEKYGTPKGYFRWCFDPRTTNPCDIGSCGTSIHFPSGYFSASDSLMWGCCGGYEGGYVCVHIDEAAGDTRGSRCK